MEISCKINKRRGWNKRIGWKIIIKSIIVGDGINIFGEKFLWNRGWNNWVAKFESLWDF